MPQNEGSLNRHERSCVPRNEPWCVVGKRATYRNRDTVSERTRRSNQAFTTIHGVPDWALAFIRLGVQFNLHGIGIEIVKINLNMK